MMRALLAVVVGCLGADVSAVPVPQLPNAAVSHLQELNLEQVRSDARRRRRSRVVRGGGLILAMLSRCS